MKNTKGLLILLILAFVIAFCSCAQKEEQTQAKKTVEKESAVTETETTAEKEAAEAKQEETTAEKETADVKQEESAEVQKAKPFLVFDDGKTQINIEFMEFVEWDEKTLEWAEEQVTGEIERFMEREVKLAPAENGIEMAISNEREWYAFLEGKIVYTTEDVISIVYDGFLYETSRMRPDNCLLAYNFDRKTGKVLSFDDLYVIDDALYTAFEEGGIKAMLELSGGEWPNLGEFSEDLCSREEFERYLAIKTEFHRIYWFYTEEGVTFSYPVLFVLGCHQEASVPYSALVSK